MKRNPEANNEKNPLKLKREIMDQRVRDKSNELL